MRRSRSWIPLPRSHPTGRPADLAESAAVVARGGERPASRGPLALVLVAGPDQNPQLGFGADSSLRKEPPTGAMITLTSCAGSVVSLRPMCPVPEST
jgi:hypothetical protein